MKKIVFIEPKAPNLHIFSMYPLPRLGNLILGTLMKKRGWDVEIIFEETRKIDFEALRSVSLVGISTITSTAPRAYAIADRVREMGLTVIMGGPHVTYLPEEALEHADFVVRGEGERPLTAFVDAWEKDQDYSAVPNLSYRRSGLVVHNPLQPFAKELDQIPAPDFSLLRKSGRRKIGERTIIPVLTSRGCPFDCSFCSVTGLFGRQYRFRSTDNVIEELRRYNYRRNIIFFYDDNFAANRKHTRDLLEAMIRERFKFKWTTQVRADVARDPEIIGLMKQAGCHTLFIGLESVNPESLKAMKKEQTIEEITEALKVLRKHRIHVHGMFVYGFDNDDWQTVKNTVKFAKKARLTSTQFLILTPLPGSEFYNRMTSEKRIAFHDWSLYDAHHAVFQPARFSLSGLQKAQIFSHKKFYSLFEQFKSLLKGKWMALGVAFYARNINRTWKKKNKTFLKVVDLLRPKKNAVVSIDYRETVTLE